MREDERIGGYFLTDRIRQRLEALPDLVVKNTADGAIFSFVFGARRGSEDPPHSVFCRVKRSDGQFTDSAAGGMTRDDAIKGIGYDTYRLVQVHEKLKNESKTEYESQISRIEETFGVDLSMSRKVEIGHVLHVRDLGYQFVEWINNSGYKTHDETVTLHDAVNNFLVLEPEDKRKIQIGSSSKALGDLISLKNQLVESGQWELIVEWEKKHYFSLVRLIKQTIWDAEHEPVTAGTKFEYTDLNGQKAVLCMFVDWNLGDPYREQSLEGAVAEETMHVAAKLHKITIELPHTNSKFLHEVEELAIEYYAAKALRDCGIDQEKINRYTSLNPDCIPIWTSIVQKIGEDIASRILFHGDPTEEEWQLLYDVLLNELGKL